MIVASIRLLPDVRIPVRYGALCGAALIAACAPKTQYAVPPSIPLAASPVAANADAAGAQANEMIQRVMATRGDFHVNDLVRLSFPYMPELDNQQRVQMSGFISPPLLSPIDVRGFTNAELQATLERQYQAKLEHPHVSVSVVEYNEPPPPREVMVMGEVTTPGAMPYRENITLIEALARAGGQTNLADLSQVVVLTPAQDRIEARLIDLKAILNGQGGAMAQLDPSTIVIVPSTRLARIADKATQIRSIVGINGISLGWRFDILN